MTQRKESSNRRATLVDGRDENNLAEFPIALLGDTASPGQKSIEFEDTMVDWETGRTIVRRVCITGSDKFGLPTAKDDEVLLALIQLTKIANNFTNPEVWFVKRDVLEILEWENRGWAYDRVEESLHRWKGVSVHYWNAWRDQSSGKWKDSSAVGVIDYFTLSDGRRQAHGVNQHAGKSRFSWNKLFFESFQAGYVKRLDFAAYRSLHRPAAKRAYRFLDKRFWHKDDWEFDLREFACEKLGFSRSYSTGQLKERLRPALGELEEVGFIEPVELRKERPKVWTLGVRKKQVTVQKCEQMPSSSGGLEGELIRHGVSPSVAHDLVGKHADSFIRERIALVDWLIAKGDKRVSKSQSGFLVAAIEKSYLLPRDFVKATRSTVIGPTKPAHSPGATTKNESVNRVAVEEDHIDKYIRKLGADKRADLMVQAVEAASSVELSSLERLKSQQSPLASTIEVSILRKYLEKVGNVDAASAA